MVFPMMHVNLSNGIYVIVCKGSRSHLLKVSGQFYLRESRKARYWNHCCSTFSWMTSFMSFMTRVFLYNYADDNMLSCSHSDLGVLKSQLEDSMKIALKWFHKYQMKANPSKFQFIVLKNCTTDADIELAISNEVMKPVSGVKLLGFTIDDKMYFDEHISSLCIKAARQTNALCGFVKHMPNDSRLNVYNAFIASIFNYCSIVWYYCSRRKHHQEGSKGNLKWLRFSIFDCA